MNQYEKDLERVKRDGYSLQYVKEQTPEICLAAIKQNKKSVPYIKNLTDDILRYLIENNIKFDLTDPGRIDTNIPDDLKLLLIINYNVSSLSFS